MAGHSQFKNIMHRKGAQDKKRANLFNKLAREITVSAKLGMADINANPRLRAAVLKARSVNMPNDRVDRAIKAATDKADTSNYEEVRYEGYAAPGIAVIVEGLTDNRNRTAADLRMIFTKNGGTMGEAGSVAFLFTRCGSIIYAASAASADAMFEVAAGAGADDVQSHAEAHEITTSVENFAAVRDALEAKFGAPQQAQILWQPNALQEPADSDTAKQAYKIIDLLDDHDDVQQVYTNCSFTAAQLAELEQ